MCPYVRNTRYNGLIHDDLYRPETFQKLEKNPLTLTVLGYFAPWKYWGGGGGGAKIAAKFGTHLRNCAKRKTSVLFFFSKIANFISYDNLCKLYA